MILPLKTAPDLSLRLPPYSPLYQNRPLHFAGHERQGSGWPRLRRRTRLNIITAKGFVMTPHPYFNSLQSPVVVLQA